MSQDKQEDFSKVKDDFVSNVTEESSKSNPFKRFWSWATEDKSRIGSLIFLLLFFVLIIVLASLNMNLGQIMQDIVDWFEMKVGMFGIYLGVFIISTFGNFTVIFPIPYTLALITVATRADIQAYEILLMGLFAGAGASIGEASAWLLGKASKNVIEDGMEKQVSKAKRWIDRGLAPLIIFLFAATPLPDDAVLVFIGLLGYALWKTIIWCFLGKIVLTTATGFAAKYLGNTSIGEKILWLFGLVSDNGSVTAGEPNPWVSAVVWIVSMIVIGIILFVDWNDVWNFISRSIYKNRLIKLAYIIDNGSKANEANLSSKNDVDLSTETIKIKRDDAHWQCLLENVKFDTPDYFDFYTIQYLFGPDFDIILNSEWTRNFLTFIKNTNGEEIEKNNVEQIIPPKELREEEAEINFSDGKYFLEIKYKADPIKRMFTLRYLLEKIPENETMRIKCLGEKEALTIKRIKNSDAEIITKKLVSLILQLPTKPTLFEAIKIGSTIEV